MVNQAIVNVSASEFGALADFVTAQMRRLAVPGVGLGILYGERSIAAGFGVTNINHPLPVTTDTLFQVGSISKTFVATAIMRLVEMGKLDLDTPVQAYIPAFRVEDTQAAHAVTLRHLLSHTAGWPGDYFYDTGRGDDALARFVEKMSDLSQQTPVGELFAYNNAAFGLAGHIIEVVTGKTFEQAVHDLVLAPLVMSNTCYFPEDIMTRSYVSGHTKTVDGARVVEPWALTRSSHAAGGVLSSVADMLRYARFHLGKGITQDGTVVLQESTVDTMRMPQTVGGCFTDEVGISWLINHYDKSRTIGHAGSTNGQTALFSFIPEHDFAFVCLTNHEYGSVLYQEVLEWVLDRYLDIHPIAPIHLDRSPEQLQAYAGHYEAVLNDVIVKVEEGSLVLEFWDKGGFPTADNAVTPTEPAFAIRLALLAEDRVISLDEPMKGSYAEFIRDDAGKIAWFRFQGRLHRPVR